MDIRTELSIKSNPLFDDLVHIENFSVDLLLMTALATVKGLCDPQLDCLVGDGSHKYVLQ